MPKACDQNVSNPRRQSIRQKPKVAPLPDISDDEVRMPPGYQPSDDSEERYIPQPPVKKMKVSPDSEPEEDQNKKKDRSVKKSAKGRGVRNSKSVISKPQNNIKNCFMCKDKEGRNMSSLQDMKYRYHCAKCAYGTGEFLKYVPHHQGATKEKTSDLEEFGSLWRYKCPFEGCDKNTGKAKAKSMGYKEFAIHCGAMHGVLERWAAESELDGAPEFHKTLKSWRESEGKELPEMPEVKAEEVHICYICNGADKESKNLSLAPDRIKIHATRYHYASCLYDSKVYYDMYDPTDQNKNPDGSPRDILGRDVKYNCMLCESSNRKRRMGYKEFAVHQAFVHEGLEQVLTNHPDERLRSLIPRLARR